MLSARCDVPMLGMFHIIRTSKEAMTVQIRSSVGTFLCADGGHVHLAPKCRWAYWNIVRHFSNLRRRPKDGLQASRIARGYLTNDGEACVWLQLAGTTSYLSHLGGQALLAPWSAWNSSKLQTRWALGVRQPWRVEVVGRRPATIIDIGKGSSSADVWVLVSPNYAPHLNQFISALWEAGDHVCLHVQRIPQLRDAHQSGWHETWNYAFFTQLRVISLFDAMLWAARRPHEPVSSIVVVDLDVQVFPGWVDALHSCTSESVGAHVCFMQQPGHALEYIEPINAGLIFLDGRSIQAARLPHAMLARLQGTDIIWHLTGAAGLEHDQMILNAILARVAQEHSHGSLRWGFYNPAVAYVGMQPADTFLSLRIHHATWSAASMPEKLRLIAVQSKLITRFRRYCGFTVPQSPVAFDAPCLYHLHDDPHFGPPSQQVRIYQPFHITAMRAGSRDRPIGKFLGDQVVANRIWAEEWRHTRQRSALQEEDESFSNTDTHSKPASPSTDLTSRNLTAECLDVFDNGIWASLSGVGYEEVVMNANMCVETGGVWLDIRSQLVSESFGICAPLLPVCYSTEGTDLAWHFLVHHALPNRDSKTTAPTKPDTVFVHLRLSTHEEIERAAEEGSLVAKSMTMIQHR